MSGLSGLIPDIGKVFDPLGLFRGDAPDRVQNGPNGTNNGRGPETTPQLEGRHGGPPDGSDPSGTGNGNRDPGASGPNGPSQNGGAQGQQGSQGAGQGQQPTFNPSPSPSLQFPPLPGPPSPIVSIVQSVVALPGALINGLFHAQPPSYSSQGTQDFARYSNTPAPSNNPGTVPSAPPTATPQPAASPGNSAFGHAQGNGPSARTDGGILPNALGSVREVLTTLLAPAAAAAGNTAQAAAAQLGAMASNPIPLAASVPAPVPIASTPAAALPVATTPAAVPTSALAAPPAALASMSAQPMPAAPLATTASMSTPLASAAGTAGALASAVPAQQLVAAPQTLSAIPVRADAVALPGQTMAAVPVVAPPPGQTAPAALGASGATAAQAQAMAAVGNTAAVPLSQQAAIDARGLPLSGADRAQQNARADMAMIAGHTGETRQRSLRQRMMGTLTTPMSQLLAALAGNDFPRTRRHLDERQQAAQDLERAMQWVFWVLATAAYGCLILAIVIFAAGSQDLSFQIPEMRSYTTGFAMAGLVAGAGAWWLARRLSRN